jgi:hypothetical protein
MDTETFLVTRDRVMARLANRRQIALEATAEKHAHNGSWLGPSVPFWLRFALNMILPKSFSGFWPQALMTAAPVVFGLAKSVTGKFREESEPLGGLLRFFPIVKSLIKRYN